MQVCKCLHFYVVAVSLSCPALLPPQLLWQHTQHLGRPSSAHWLSHPGSLGLSGDGKGMGRGWEGMGGGGGGGDGKGG